MGAKAGSANSRTASTEGCFMGPRGLELEMDGPGYGDDGCAIADRGGGGDCAVGRGDAVDLLTAVDLIERHGAEDGRKHHAGRVNVNEVFVPFHAAAGVLVGDFGSADSVGGGPGVHSDGGGAEGDMEIAVGGVAVVAAFRWRADGADAGGGDRDDGDEAEALVELEHVGAAVHDGLAGGATLGVCRRQPEVAKRRRAGRSWRTLRGRLRGRGSAG